MLLTIAASPNLLYVGIADASLSPTNAGLIMAADVGSGIVAPLHATLPITSGVATLTTGITGLAFNKAGTLYGATSAGPGSTSSLVRIDPTTGAQISGSSTPIMANSHPISIGDLAYQASTDRLFAIRSADDGEPGAVGKLYVIDPNTGVATFVGDPGTLHDGGLAFTPDGSTLYFASADRLTGLPQLYTLDPTNGMIHSTVSLSMAPGLSGYVTGLDVRSDSVLVGTDSINDNLVTIDPATGARAILPMQSPIRGLPGDVAFQPPGNETLQQVYHEDFESGTGNYTVDNSGGTFPGLWHYSLGREDDHLLDHTPLHSFYYGQFETTTTGGDYSEPFGSQGVIISPAIQLPATGTSIASFSYQLQTRLETDRDFVDVSVVDGTSITTILSRQNGTLPQTGVTQWLTPTYDLTAFAGQTIHLRFSFRTGDPPPKDPEGWFVDDIQIANIPPQADLGITKSDSDGGSSGPPAMIGTAVPGTPITYTIVVNNLIGPSDVTGALVNDVFPSTLTDVSWMRSDGETGSGNIVNDPVNLPVGSTITYTVHATISASATVPLSNTATVSAPTGVTDPNPNNNSATDTDNLTPEADLGITKSDNDGGSSGPPAVIGTAVPGTPITYTIVVTNAGPSNATGATVADTLPSTLTGATFTATATGGATGFMGSGTGNINDTAVNVPVGSTITYLVQANISLSATGLLTNTATVTAPTGVTDPNLANNSATDTDGLSPPPVVQFITPLGVARPDGRFVKPPTSQIAVTGYIWFDQDGNGTWSGSELGLNGVTVYVDLNNNGVRDATEPTFTTVNDGNHDGAFWFTKTQFNGSEIVRVDLPVGTTSFPSTPLTVDPGTPQFGNFGQSKSPNFGITNDFVNSPPAAKGTVKGYLWDDLNQNGQWDSVAGITEPGLAGWRVFVDMSPNHNGIFDPAIDPFTTTGADGGYVFSNLAAGSYSIGVDQLGSSAVSDGTFFVEKFPAADPPTGLHEQVVTVNAGQVVNGRSNMTEAPNFGLFFYSPLVRPALDMTINVSDGKLAAVPGTPNTYTITVANQFDSYNVIGATVQDNFPSVLSGITWTATATGGATGSVVSGSGNINDTVNMPPGSTVTYTVQANISSSATGTLTNTATVTPPGGSPISAADTDTLGITSSPSAPSPDKLDAVLLAALQPWQSFTVPNTTGHPLEITQIQKVIDISAISAAKGFVQVFQQLSDGTLTLVPNGVLAMPIIVPVGGAVNFFVFYDPVSFDVATQTTQQYPGWYGAQATANPAHSFAPTDHLEVDTQFTDATPGHPTYQFSLVGGSTYDSDIFYDGAVDNGDLVRLNADLLQTQWPVNQGTVAERVQIRGTGLNGTFTLGYQGTTSVPLHLNDTVSVIQAAIVSIIPAGIGVQVTHLGAQGDSDWEIAFSGPSNLPTYLTGFSSLTLDTSGITSGTITLQEATRLPYDATSDINSIYRNGVNGQDPVATWPQDIGLGDYGTLNVEWNRARAPFLDLDPDNSSRAGGANYTVPFVSPSVAIADTDASFANSASRVIQNMTVTITNFSLGDVLAAITAGTSISASFSGGMLSLTGSDTVADYARVLKTITFGTSDRMPRTVEVDVIATGSTTAGPAQSFTNLSTTPGDVSQVTGNTARAFVIITATAGDLPQTVVPAAAIGPIPIGDGPTPGPASSDLRAAAPISSNAATLDGKADGSGTFAASAPASESPPAVLFTSIDVENSVPINAVLPAISDSVVFASGMPVDMIAGAAQSTLPPMAPPDALAVSSPSLLESQPASSASATATVMILPHFSTTNAGAPQMVGVANQAAQTNTGAALQRPNLSSPALQAVWNDDQLEVDDAADALSADQAPRQDLNLSEGTNVARLDWVFGEIGAKTVGTSILG